MADQNKQNQNDSNRKSGNFADDPQRASEAGRKGGQKSGGNFANDPERASEAGRKGGEQGRGSLKDQSGNNDQKR
jgi:uncharacterized protein